MYNFYLFSFHYKNLYRHRNGCIYRNERATRKKTGKGGERIDPCFIFLIWESCLCCFVIWKELRICLKDSRWRFWSEANTIYKNILIRLTYRRYIIFIIIWKKYIGKTFFYSQKSNIAYLTQYQKLWYSIFEKKNDQTWNRSARHT